MTLQSSANGQVLPVGKCLLCEVERLQKREWVGLTDEEIWDCYSSQGNLFYKAIEAKLKEKNSGS